MVGLSCVSWGQWLHVSTRLKASADYDGWAEVPAECKLPRACSPFCLFSALFPGQDRRGIAYNDERSGEYGLGHDA